MLKIDLHYLSRKRAGAFFYQRCIPQLAELDVDLRCHCDALPDRGRKADGYILQHYYAESAMLDGLHNVFIDEHVDSATPISRDALKHERVIGMFKTATLWEEFVNVDSVRYHATLLGKPPNKPEVFLSHLETNKLIPGLSFLFRSRVVSLTKMSDADPVSWENRRYDISFVGTVEGYEDAISTHRRQLCSALNQVGKMLRICCIDKPDLDRKSYLALMRESKIVVSPWGNGETCLRDYEAMLMGCAVIKPNTDFALTIENLKSGRNYAETRMDWSDLYEVAASLLNNASKTSSMIRMNRMLCAEWCCPKMVSKWLGKIIVTRFK